MSGVLQPHLQTLSAETNPFRRPALLTQHLNLISSTHTLTALLLSPNPTQDAQLQALQDFLSQEARDKNLFAAPSAAQSSALAASGNDALGLGASTSAERLATAEGMPLVQFADPKSLLPRLSTHPLQPLDAERAGRLQGLLRTRLDTAPENAMAETWASWCEANPVEEGDDGADVAHARLRLARTQEREYDEMCEAALRAWWHVKEQPDEEGERYDWKMRITAEDLAAEAEDDDTQMADAQAPPEVQEAEWSVKDICAFMSGRSAASTSAP